MTMTQTVPQDTVTAMLKVGTFNNHNDPTMVAWDEKGQTKIAQIFIWHSSYIHALAFHYIDDEDGNLVLSPTFGCSDLEHTNFDTVTFMDPRNEYIKRVSGSYGTRDFCDKGVTSLTVETSESTYGPFGYTQTQSKDKSFNYRFGPQNQFGGFHGLSRSKFISSIGVYVQLFKNIDALSKQTGIPIIRYKQPENS